MTRRMVHRNNSASRHTSRHTSQYKVGSSAAPGTDDLPALAHGTFNVVSGVWPLVHMRSFEKVRVWPTLLCPCTIRAPIPLRTITACQESSFADSSVLRRAGAYGVTAGATPGRRVRAEHADLRSRPMTR